MLRADGSQCTPPYCSQKLLQQEVTLFPPPWEAKRDEPLAHPVSCAAHRNAPLAFPGPRFLLVGRLISPLQGCESALWVENVTVGLWLNEGSGLCRIQLKSFCLGGQW